MGAGWYRCCQAIAAGMMPKRERMPKAPVVLWSSFSFVDKTVSARGKFTNTAPNIEIQSTGSSIIEELNLERGQFIKKRSNSSST